VRTCCVVLLEILDACQKWRATLEGRTGTLGVTAEPPCFFNRMPRPTCNKSCIQHETCACVRSSVRSCLLASCLLACLFCRLANERATERARNRASVKPSEHDNDDDDHDDTHHHQTWRTLPGQPIRILSQETPPRRHPQNERD
jgi:hypothetical protein